MGCMASKGLDSEVRFREGPDLLPVPPALEVGVKQYHVESAQVEFPEVSVKSKSSRLAAKQAAKQKMAALMEQQNVEVIKALEEQKVEMMKKNEKFEDDLAAMQDEETLAAVKDEGELAGLWYDIDDDSFITVEDEVSEPKPTPYETDMEDGDPAEAPVLSDAVVDKLYGAHTMSPITASSSDHTESVTDKIHGAPIMSPITASSSDHADLVIDKIHGAPMSPITVSSSIHAEEEVVHDGEAAVESKEAEVEQNEPAEVPMPRHAVIRRIYGRSSASPKTSKSPGDVLAGGMEVDVLNIAYEIPEEPKTQPKSRNSITTRRKEIMTESGDLQKRYRQMKKKTRKVDKNYRKEDFSVEWQPFQSEAVRSARKTEVQKTHQNLHARAANAGEIPSETPGISIIVG